MRFSRNEGINYFIVKKGRWNFPVGPKWKLLQDALSKDR